MRAPRSLVAGLAIALAAVTLAACSSTSSGSSSSNSITLYDQTKEIVCYARCWERGRTFGAERFQKELYAQMAAAQRSATQQRLIALLGP